MTPNLAEYTEACNYPGRLDEAAVHAALTEYCAALGVKRQIVRLTKDFEVQEIAQAARDARAINSEDLRTSAWYWHGELSWLSTYALGALELKYGGVSRWADPAYRAFIAGTWCLHWTDDTLYWFAKPIVRTEPAMFRRRLHCETAPAVEGGYEDWYYLHGVWVTKQIVMAPATLTAADVRAEENTEVRRIMIERMGVAKFVREADAQISGPGARPMHPDWARSIRDQCFVARVPFFFKQLGIAQSRPKETGVDV